MKPSEGKAIDELPVFYDTLDLEKGMVFVGDKYRPGKSFNDDITSQILDYHYFAIYIA